MEVLMIGRNGVDGVGTYIFDLAKQLSINHTVWFHGINPFIKFGSKIKKESKIVPGKYDVAFINYFQVFPTVDCKKIYHVHLAQIKSGFKDNILDVFQNETNFHVTYNSDFQRQQLIAMDIDTSLITKIPNYINENTYKIMPSVNKIPNSILLMCGIRRNNIPVWKPMIKAMNQLPEYRLSIMGSLDESLEDEFDEYLNNARNNNIEYIGEITDNDVVEELEKIKKEGNKKTKTIKKPKPKVKSTKVKTINKHEIGIGVGRSAREMILCGLPTLVYREGFAGWLTDSNVDQLEKDNFTTRLFVEIEEDLKIDNIVKSIKKPETYDRAVAVTKFGLNANFDKYEILMGL
jgi:glycosyltransferase involved in cell wall biosynthesis